MRLRTILVFCIALGGLNLSACKKTEETLNKAGCEIVAAKVKQANEVLNFTGNINPIRVYAVAAPAKGIIEEMFFVYGQRVKAGSQLATIYASDLEKEYRDSLSQFLKSENDLMQKKNKYESAKELYHAGVISDDEFKQNEGDFESQMLSFYNERFKLLRLSNTFQLKKIKFEKLKVSELDSVRKYLTNFSGMVPVTSKHSGVALLPEKTEENEKQINLGSEVDKGKEILIIGDTTGIKINIKVSETDLHRLKPGLPATVSGPGFKEAMKGQVEKVGFQAVENSSGVSIFPATIVVPKLTAEQQAEVRVGMSALVSVTIAGPKKLMVPIDAVKLKNNKTAVSKFMGSDQFKDVFVTTGVTHQENVEILEGLKEGDKVCVKVDDDQAE